MALIPSIFLYNSELWSLSCAKNKEIDIFQRKFLRQIIGNYKVTNTVLYKSCSIEPWSRTIQRRRLSWFGHLHRLPAEAPARLALAEARKPYKRVRGGQCVTWLSCIAKDLKKVGKTISEAAAIAHDRLSYMQLVHDTMAPDHQPRAGALQ